MAKKRKKKTLRRRIRRKTEAEQIVEDNYQHLHREIVLYGRREAKKELRRLCPSIRSRDAQWIIRRIAEGEPVQADTVELKILVRKWWGSPSDVLRSVHRRLGKKLSYDLILK